MRKLSFTASIFDSLSGFPHNHPPIQGLALPAVPPANSRAIFEALAAQLDIIDVDTTNREVDFAAIPQERKPPAPRPREQTVKKYLPELIARRSISRVRGTGTS